jgi:hypothetical protein
MSSNEIAFTSVIATAAVGLAAVLVSLIGGFLDRRHAREMARTDRSQTRLERTYLELVGYVHRRRMEANAVRPFMTFPDQLEPVPVTAEEIERVQSLVVTIASKDVRDLIGEFAEVQADIHNADAAMSGIEHAESQTGQPENPAEWGGSVPEFRERILADQHKLSDIEDRLHEQIRHELSM